MKKGIKGWLYTPLFIGDNMNIRINIKFDDDEKLVLQKIPKDAVDSFVKFASENALDSISKELAAFFTLVELYGYVGNKEGDFS